MNVVPRIVEPATVEPKDILAKIVLKVFRFESPVKGIPDEPFDQGCHYMDTI